MEEKSLEERKVEALESIAATLSESARIFALVKQQESLSFASEALEKKAKYGLMTELMKPENEPTSAK